METLSSNKDLEVEQYLFSIKTQTIGWVLLVSFFVTASGVSTPLTVNSTENMLRKAAHNYPSFVEFCQRERKCINVDVNEVVKNYPNLLKETVHERSIRNKVVNKRNSDFDSCCSTLRAFDNSLNRTNTAGVERQIFQTKDLRQLIPIGRCMKNGKCTKCQIRNRTMSILVIDFDFKRGLPVEFDQFSIPLYCTCSDK